MVPPMRLGESRSRSAAPEVVKVLKPLRENPAGVGNPPREHGPVCVDLDRHFGDRFRVVNEPGGPPPKPKAKDPWLREIRCRHGRIYPMGATTLAAWTGTPRRARRLLAIPGVKRHQVGDGEATVTFPLDSPAQAQLFDLVKPFRRRRLSPDARARATDQLARVRLVPV